MGNKEEQGFTWFFLYQSSTPSRPTVLSSLAWYFWPTEGISWLMNAPSFCTKSFWKPHAIWSTLSMTLRARFWQGNFHCGDGSPFTSRSLQSISWHLSAVAKRGLCPLWSDPSVPKGIVCSACLDSPWSKGTSVWSSPQQARHPQPPQLTLQKSEAVMSMCFMAALWSQDQTWLSVIWWASKGHICMVKQQNTTRHVLPSTAGAEGWQMSFLLSSGLEESSQVHRQHSGRINITVPGPFGPMSGSHALELQV